MSDRTLNMTVMMPRSVTVEYSYQDWDGDPDEDDQSYICDRIFNGYLEGELNTTDPDTKVSHRGWWKMTEEDYAK